MTVQEAKKELEICNELMLVDFSYGEEIPYESLNESNKKLYDAHIIAIQALEELEQYRALGTVEELKEAREKQVAKKPKVNPLGQDIEVECPVCGYIHIFLDTKKGDKYCNECGQAIDWEEGGTSE